MGYATRAFTLVVILGLVACSGGSDNDGSEQAASNETSQPESPNEGDGINDGPALVYENGDGNFEQGRVIMLNTEGRSLTELRIANEITQFSQFRELATFDTNGLPPGEHSIQARWSDDTISHETLVVLVSTIDSTPQAYFNDYLGRLEAILVDQQSDPAVSRAASEELARMADLFATLDTAERQAAAHFVHANGLQDLIAGLQIPATDIAMPANLQLNRAYFSGAYNLRSLEQCDQTFNWLRPKVLAIATLATTVGVLGGIAPDPITTALSLTTIAVAIIKIHDEITHVYECYIDTGIRALRADLDNLLSERTTNIANLLASDTARDTAFANAETTPMRFTVNHGQSIGFKVITESSIEDYISESFVSMVNAIGRVSNALAGTLSNFTSINVAGISSELRSFGRTIEQPDAPDNYRVTGLSSDRIDVTRSRRGDALELIFKWRSGEALETPLDFSFDIVKTDQPLQTTLHGALNGAQLPLVEPLGFEIGSGETYEARFTGEFVDRFILVERPANGNLTLLDDGTGLFRYKPNRGYVGDDAFAIVARNDFGESDRVTIDVKILEDDRFTMRGLDDGAVLTTNRIDLSFGSSLPEFRKFDVELFLDKEPLGCGFQQSNDYQNLDCYDNYNAQTNTLHLSNIRNGSHTLRATWTNKGETFIQEREFEKSCGPKPVIEPIQVCETGNAMTGLFVSGFENADWFSAQPFYGEIPTWVVTQRDTDGDGTTSTRYRTPYISSPGYLAVDLSEDHGKSWAMGGQGFCGYLRVGIVEYVEVTVNDSCQWSNTVQLKNPYDSD
ncbi:hypothetical protein [Salinisphaera sp.]|uniref:hypothetical protein n=1 Tax=Salinisphaera sp. TaxID=1914330 RepID=UPI0025E4595E|nr:hypothetical protein [Salinisphaera sp.]|tara:strand:+ start:360 stop:2741 length:2382 start_codon:yes stop_codon:yes gene_type:complete